MIWFSAPPDSLPRIRFELAVRNIPYRVWIPRDGIGYAAECIVRGRGRDATRWRSIAQRRFVDLLDSIDLRVVERKVRNALEYLEGARE